MAVVSDGLSSVAYLNKCSGRRMDGRPDGRMPNERRPWEREGASTKIENPGDTDFRAKSSKEEDTVL